MRLVLSEKKKAMLWFIVFKIVLDLTYVLIQADAYGYYGFSFEPNIAKWLFSWILYLFTGLCVASDKTNCCTIFSYTVFMLSLAPAFVYYEYNPEAKLWMLLAQALTLVLMNAIMGALTAKVKIKNKKIPYTSRRLSFIVVLVLGAYFVYSFVTNGLPSLGSLSWENVSEIRANSNVSTLMAIIQNLLCRIVCPITLMLLFKSRKWVGFALVLVIQLYTYAITGFKTYLFIPLVLIAVSILPKINLKKLISFALPCVVVLCNLIYKVLGEIYPYALINERVLFLPAKIKFAYFDYFSSHDFVYFSQSTIAKLFGFESNYSQNIPNLIGDVYFNRPEMWTNTGFMADAYANLGILGMVLIGVLLAVILAWVDVTVECDSPDVMLGIQSMFLLYYISLNDGSAISVFFSGGMIFAVLLVLFISFNGRMRKRKGIKRVKTAEVSENG